MVDSTEFGAQMNEMFQHDICFARRVAKGDWKQRPLRDRLDTVGSDACTLFALEPGDEKGALE